MIVDTTRSRTTRPVAWTLLALQILAGGAVPLAHARERETAPIGIEAKHDASCVVLHDAMRCALCHYATSLSTPSSAAVLGARMPAGRSAIRGRPSGHPRLATHAGARPRAPPLSLS